MPETYYILEGPSHCGTYHEHWQEITTKLNTDGWKRTKNIKLSDIILVKQCCMTTEEIDNAMSALVELSRKKVQGKVFLGECLSQTTDLIEALKEKLPDWKFSQFTTPAEFFYQLEGRFEPNATPTLMVLEDGNALVNISYGCKRKCAFCKVAYMKQEFYSVPLEEVLEKIWLAKQQGIKKVTLNASNSTEYNDAGRDLSDLLKAVLEIPDMIYHVNGMALVELTEETIEILRNPRFVLVQMELQSFIPEVREKMEVGAIDIPKVLSIFKKMQGKAIYSTIITGFCRENNANFRQQLKIIEDNNLFFFATTNLIATPGTKAGELRNPSALQAQYRMTELVKLLMKLRKKVAQEMIGKEQQGIVFALKPEQLVLCGNGVMVKTDQKGLEIGKRVTVTPRCIRTLFGAQDQVFILSTKEGDEVAAGANMNEEQAVKMMSSMLAMEMATNQSSGGPNMAPGTLRQYCKDYLTREMKKS